MMLHATVMYRILVLYCCYYSILLFFYLLFVPKYFDSIGGRCVCRLCLSMPNADCRCRLSIVNCCILIFFIFFCRCVHCVCRCRLCCVCQCRLSIVGIDFLFCCSMTLSHSKASLYHFSSFHSWVVQLVILLKRFHLRQCTPCS